MSESPVHVAVSQTNAFACDLNRELGGSNDNLFFSPFSIAVALSMVREGARGETQKEMDRVLHVSRGSPAEELGELTGSLEPRMVRDGYGDTAQKVKVYELHIANAVWGQSGFGFEQSFTRLLKGGYGAALRRIDFRQTAKARKAINDWVATATRKKIEDIVPENLPTPDTRMALANAIYFKASWLEPFQERATKKQKFTTLAGAAVQADMMRRTAGLAYADLGGVQLVELPYRDGDTSMVIVLPRAVDGARKLAKTLTHQQLRKWCSALKHQRVALELPKFRFTSSFRLEETLQGMGMKLAFHPQRADFSGMTKEDKLCIGPVLHKAFVAVDEKGTEAAAATVVLMKRAGFDPSKPVSFVADHPFLFVIRHGKTECVLFLGCVADPTKS